MPPKAKKEKKKMKKVAKAAAKVAVKEVVHRAAHPKPPRARPKAAAPDPITRAAEVDSAQCVKQLLDASGLWSRDVGGGTPQQAPVGLVGPPTGARNASVCFVTCTEMNANTVAWTGATTNNSLRILALPNAATALCWGTAYTSLGAVTSTGVNSTIGQSDWVNLYESVAFCGGVLVANCSTKGTDFGGYSHGLTYQNVGASCADVLGQASSTFQSYAGIDWNMVRAEHLACPLISNNWPIDHAYVAPGYAVQADNASIVMEFVGPASTIQSMRFRYYQVWSGIPLANTVNSASPPRTDYVDESKVSTILSAELVKLGQYSIPRCIRKDGVVEDVKSTWGSATSLADAVGKGDWSGGLAAAISLGRSAWSLGTTIGGLFGARERMARMLRTLTLEDRAANADLVRLSDLALDEVIHQGAMARPGYRRRHVALSAIRTSGGGWPVVDCGGGVALDTRTGRHFAWTKEAPQWDDEQGNRVFDAEEEKAYAEAAPRRRLGAAALAAAPPPSPASSRRAASQPPRP